jgi:hypothetical protein
MTDRERLLELKREAEKMAAATGEWALGAMKLGADDVEYWAKKSAHHALTALALRDALWSHEYLAMNNHVPDAAS